MEPYKANWAVGMLLAGLFVLLLGASSAAPAAAYSKYASTCSSKLAPPFAGPLPVAMSQRHNPTSTGHIPFPVQFLVTGTSKIAWHHPAAAERPQSVLDVVGFPGWHAILSVVLLRMTDVGHHELVDTEADCEALLMTFDGLRTVVGKPFRHHLFVPAMARGSTMLAEVHIVTVEADDRETRRLMKAIRRDTRGASGHF